MSTNDLLVSLAVFVNCDEDHSRLGGAGVYVIFSGVSEQIYIGSTNGFSVRWSQHKTKLRSGRHTNKTLLVDWMRYGECAFLFGILEYVPMPYPYTAAQYDQLIDAERAWQIRYQGSLYNQPCSPTTSEQRQRNRVAQKHWRERHGK